MCDLKLLIYFSQALL